MKTDPDAESNIDPQPSSSPGGGDLSKEGETGRITFPVEGGVVSAGLVAGYTKVGGEETEGTSNIQHPTPNIQSPDVIVIDHNDADGVGGGPLAGTAFGDPTGLAASQSDTIDGTAFGDPSGITGAKGGPGTPGPDFPWPTSAPGVGAPGLDAHFEPVAEPEGEVSPSIGSPHNGGGPVSAMQFLGGDPEGRKWYFADNHFTRPGIYYWNGTANIHAGDEIAALKSQLAEDAKPSITTEQLTASQLPARPPAPSEVPPLYECHKQVRAFQIATVDRSFVRSQIVPVDDTLPRVEVSAEWDARHEPQAGGYYIIYEDGYASYSPAAPFEAGYTRI